MRLKTSGSDAGGGGGAALLLGGGAVPRCGLRPRGVGGDGGASGHRPGAAVPSGRWWGGERVSVPPARSRWPLIYRAPPVGQEVRRLALRGPGAV